MDRLVCSVCGFTDKQRKFKWLDINEHFDRAKEVWCPTNKCKENNKNKRIVPKGYVCNCWYEYSGWYTIEEQPKIIDIDEAKSIQKAKRLRDMGMQILQERGDFHGKSKI